MHRTILLALAACHLPDAPAQAESASEPEPVVDPGRLDFGAFAPTNLVVIQVDTLRADALPAYGGVHDTLPMLGRRSGWIGVDHALSTATWTAPSTASLLTAQDQPDDGVRTFGEDGPTSPLTAPTLTRRLRDAGYATAMFTGSGLLMQDALGLGDAFEVAHLMIDDPGNAEAVMQAGAGWILEDRPAEQPFFLYLQPVDPHIPYDPEVEDLGTWADLDALPFRVNDPAEKQESDLLAALDAAAGPDEQAAILAQARNVYDEQVLGLDRAVERLFVALEAAGHLDDTLVVLTADHGDSFRDGPPLMLGHGIVTRHEITRLPLMFWGAGLADAMVPCVASNMDTLPTALDLLGLEPAPGVGGRSLRETCRERAFSAVYEASDGGEVVTWLAVEDATRQVARDCTTGEDMAFDLAADPLAAQALPVDALDGAPALADALTEYGDEVAGKLPGIRCTTPP